MKAPAISKHRRIEALRKIFNHWDSLTKDNIVVLLSQHLGIDEKQISSVLYKDLKELVDDEFLVVRGVDGGETHPWDENGRAISGQKFMWSRAKSDLSQTGSNLIESFGGRVAFCTEKKGIHCFSALPFSASEDATVVFNCGLKAIYFNYMDVAPVTLTFVRNNTLGQELKAKDNEIIILVPDPRVSSHKNSTLRAHFTIHFLKNGKALVEDYASSNGTVLKSLGDLRAQDLAPKLRGDLNSTENHSLDLAFKGLRAKEVELEAHKQMAVTKPVVINFGDSYLYFC